MFKSGCGHLMLKYACCMHALCKHIANPHAECLPSTPSGMLQQLHSNSVSVAGSTLQACHATCMLPAGCTVAYQAMDADAAWRRAKEALADEAAAAPQYTYSARQPPRGPEQQLEVCSTHWHPHLAPATWSLMQTMPVTLKLGSFDNFRALLMHVHAAEPAAAGGCCSVKPFVCHL